MKKDITPLLCDGKKKVVVPSDKTVDFLKIYARTFFTEKKLPTSINTLCVN